VIASPAPLVLLAALVWACRGESPAPSQPSAEAPQRPNVLLVTIDSLRADHLNCYGYLRPTSPNLDRLAADGALFKVAVAQAPWTLPSLASLHTSRLPVEVGAIHNHDRLADSAVTAAELFRNAGYATAAFTVGAYTGTSRGFGQGFDVYENRDRTHLAADLNRMALEWLDRAGKRPFFLWIHYFDVHADYAAPAPWNSLFDDTPPAPEVARIRHLKRVINGNVALEPGDLDRIKTSYDREIAYTDAMLGELWQGLEQRGLAAGTALAVGADHGEGFMEHELLLHTLSVYDEFVRVPLVLRLPGRVPAGRRVTAQVRNLDVLPTLLELAGLDPLPDARGRSLLALLRGAGGAAPGPAPVHTDTSGHEAHYAKMSGVRPGLFDTFFSVRTEAAKLVYSVKQDRYRLFELRSDPGERSDVFPQKGAAYPELRRALDELRAAGPPSGTDAPPAEPTPGELEQLRELGYIR
jgi:arylsulfatase A-like enzyme